MQRRESHQRRVGTRTGDDRQIGIRAVEGEQVGIRRGAFEKGVHPPAIAITPAAGFPLETGGITLRGNVRGNWWEYALTANFLRQEPAHRQMEVTHDLRFDAGAILAVQQPIIGIKADQFRAVGARLAIAPRHDNRLDELLAAPPQTNEFVRKPIEQSRMNWPWCAGAEVVECGSKAFSKEMRPDDIANDAGGERVLFGNQPSGKIETRGILFFESMSQHGRRTLHYP